MATSNKAATTLTTPSDREIVISRTFDAPRRLVFDAYTKCEHLRHWMLGPEGWTMPGCQIDLRPYGEYKFTWRQENGTEMSITGAYTEITPPDRLVATERWGGDWPDTLNTMVLTEKAGRTTMTLTTLYPSKQARDAALATGMMDGANQSYDRLEAYLQKLS